MHSVDPKEEITVSPEAPSSHWIPFKGCHVLLMFATSHLTFWELPGCDICSTTDLLHPHSPSCESDKSERLCVLPSLQQSCLLMPSCNEKYHISDSSFGWKNPTWTLVPLFLLCVFSSFQFVSPSIILWGKSLLTWTVWTIAIVSATADVWTHGCI